MGNEGTCYLCQRPGGKGERELRPYGPRGEMVCFECGMRDEETTRKAFDKQLDAAGPVAVIDGTGVGPYPLTRKEDA